MNTGIKSSLIRPLALALAMALGITPAAFTPVATAQSYGSAQEQPAFTQQELDQMLAPIALYPDALLSQILMASTYPLEVVQAARWSRANPHLKGEQAVRAVESQDWDPSVKSLVAFPQILDMMDQKLNWTERLGDAFLAQQPQVMDSVQQLRQRAYAAGNLRSDDRIRVIPQDRLIMVEPAQPQVVYVPYYNPTVVYGPWWWPGYPPVYWSPWPGYYARPGISVNFFWGSGIALSSGFFFGGFDWHRHQARVVNVHNYYYNRPVVINRSTNVVRNVGPGEWRHDPDHRRGVPYRAASLRQQFGRTGESADNRRDPRGRDSTTIISNQNDRRDAQVSVSRIESNTNRRPDGRDRNDNRDARSPASRNEANANTRADGQVRNDNRPDARAPIPRPDTSTIVRPDARERSNQPDLRDARPGFGNAVNGRPDLRGQDNSARPDARGTAARVENNNDRRPEGRGRNDNRSDAGDARTPSVASAVARPVVSRPAENRPDLRASPAINRAEVRVDPRPEVRAGVGNRPAIQDSRPKIENRPAASVPAAAAPAEVRSAAIRANPAPQGVADQRSRPEPRRPEDASRQQSSGQGPGSKSAGSFREVSKKDQEKR